jgi:plasmid maintenance system antidote protein VapI
MSKKNATKQPDLTEQLRQAIADSGLTGYRIAADAGVDRGLMTRFINGDRGITLAVASRIAAYLGLSLQPIKQRKGK